MHYITIMQPKFESNPLKTKQQAFMNNKLIYFTPGSEGGEGAPLDCHIP